MPGKIICIHIGARAHYLLPKSLASQDKLETMITDTWIGSALVRKLLARFPLRLVKSFSNRFTPEINGLQVKHFSCRFLLTEVWLRMKYKNSWEQIIARNKYFQHLALPIFLQLPATTVLGTSYTSLDIFTAAAKRGQKKILFQIDPGVKEEKIVAAIIEKNAAVFPTSWQKAPAAYWQDWQKECSLSDVIMVNSDWSRQGLIEEGIDPAKIKIVDLPFQLGSQHGQFEKNYPAQFSKERPLRCLYLGTLTLRKGIHVVLEAAKRMTDYPVEFILVGHTEINESLLQLPNISYKGPATRAATDDYYKDADVFLFPTFSDGFGLTQLEAMAWQLPVIASLYCAHVVKDQYNGITMQQNDSNTLVNILTQLINQPGQLKELSANCLSTAKEYNTTRFATALTNL